MTVCDHVDGGECVLVPLYALERDEALLARIEAWRALTPEQRFERSERTRKRMNEIRAKDAREVLAIIDAERRAMAQWRTCEEVKQ